MKITTLGTSHGNATASRFNSSTLFETNNFSFLIDAGAPCDALLIRKGIDLHSLRLICITHMHADHVCGLPNLIKMFIKYPQKNHKVHIFMPEQEAITGLKTWLQAMHLQYPACSLDFSHVYEGVLYDNEIKISAFYTTHLQSNNLPASFYYVIEAEGKKIIYTGDLHSSLNDFPRHAFSETIDLCICELTHYNPEDAVPVFMQTCIKEMIFNHVHDPWHNEGEAVIKTIFKNLTFPYHIAHDGDEFII